MALKFYQISHLPKGKNKGLVGQVSIKAHSEVEAKHIFHEEYPEREVSSGPHERRIS